MNSNKISKVDVEHGAEFVSRRGFTCRVFKAHKDKSGKRLYVLRDIYPHGNQEPLQITDPLRRSELAAYLDRNKFNKKLEN